MTRIIDMRLLVQRVKARNIDAFIIYTGGGQATLYAGGMYTDAYGDPRWQAVAGPGYWTFGGEVPLADLNDFYVGPDDDGKVTLADDGEVACDRVQMTSALTPEEVADLIVRQVRVCRYHPGDDARVLLAT